MTDDRNRAARLRSAFDHSFALPATASTSDVVDLLSIRIAGDPYAIRVRDIIEIATQRKIVPVPAAARDLLGLAGIRGAIVPVFGLASILGYAIEAVRWLVLCGTHDPIALGFSELEGHTRIATSTLHVDDSAHPIRPYVKELVRADDVVRAVISIPLLVATLRTKEM